MEYWNDGMVGTEDKEKGMMEEWNNGMLGGRFIYFGRYLANHPGSAFSGAIQSV